MTALDKIIEALDYAKEECVSWIEYFDSVEEAKKVLAKVRKIKPEEVEEYQVMALTEYLDVDIYGLAQKIAYKTCISMLEKDFEIIDSD